MLFRWLWLGKASIRSEFTWRLIFRRRKEGVLERTRRYKDSEEEKAWDVIETVFLLGVRTSSKAEPIKEDVLTHSDVQTQSKELF